MDTKRPPAITPLLTRLPYNFDVIALRFIYEAMYEFSKQSKQAAESQFTIYLHPDDFALAWQAFMRTHSHSMHTETDWFPLLDHRVVSNPQMKRGIIQISAGEVLEFVS